MSTNYCLFNECFAARPLDPSDLFLRIKEFLVKDDTVTMLKRKFRSSTIRLYKNSDGIHLFPLETRCLRYVFIATLDKRLKLREMIVIVFGATNNLITGS